MMMMMMSIIIMIYLIIIIITIIIIIIIVITTTTTIYNYDQTFMEQGAKERAPWRSSFFGNNGVNKLFSHIRSRSKKQLNLSIIE